MPSQIINENRIHQLNDRDTAEGSWVIYWMQQSQRAETNHALEFAIQRANRCQCPLLVVFVVTPDYPDANLRHYHFMLEGLQETAQALQRRNLRLVIRTGNPPDVVSQLARQACEAVCDRGYLRHQKSWRRQFVKNCSCPVWMIESDAIVPVETASDKREFAARTIRSKLNEKAPGYMVDLATTPIDKSSKSLSVGSDDISKLDRFFKRLSIDRTVKPVDSWRGGTAQAKSRLRRFIRDRLDCYEDRKSVLKSYVSELGPYLHFGQISPLEVAMKIDRSRGHERSAKDAFLEELLVRRELAINFVHYESDYDQLSSLPDWASKTLKEHENDPREHRYTTSELEAAQTHDAAWNAMMLEMKHRGYLHNHLRMYWGKKIIEWTNTTGHAFRTALALNNRYFLDGRDANSYANILWLFGLHDRAHQERPIFGKIRYMSASGLRRKIDVDAYIRNVAETCQVEIRGASDECS